MPYNNRCVASAHPAHGRRGAAQRQQRRRRRARAWRPAATSQHCGGGPWSGPPLCCAMWATYW